MGGNRRRGSTITVFVAILVIAVSACSSSGDSTTATTATSSTSAASNPPELSTTTEPSSGVRVASTTAPEGFSVPGATWIAITRPDGITQPAAVFRPQSDAEHPVVVMLHGSSGLSKIQLAWAPQLAAAGYVVVVGCYLDADPVSVQATPGLFMPCPGLPDSEHETTSTSAAGYGALLDAAAELPGVDVDAIGTVGVSLGAILALSTDEPRVKAIAADSGYRRTPGTTQTPVLLLGMQDDPNVEHDKLVSFESAQRDAGKPIESHFYPGTGHVTIYQPVAADATSRITTFLGDHLR